MTQEQAIPALRFPEFSDKWNIKKLDDISTITRLAGAEYSDVWYTDPDGAIIALRGFNIGNNALNLQNVERISNELSLKLSRSRLNKNDIVFPCVGSIGKAYLVKDSDKFHINQNIAKITPSIEVYPLYLLYCLLSNKSARQVIQYNTSSSQPNVLVGNLRRFTFCFPNNLGEQQKIADFLGAVDKKIAQLQKKKDLLEDYKKGCMQKLFSQEIRFTDNNGNPFPDWEQKELGEVSDCLDNKRKPLNSTERDNMQGPYPYYGANGHLDNISEYIFDEQLILLAEDGGNFDEFSTRPIAQSISGKAWVNNHAHVLRARAGITNHEYLFQILVHKDIRKYINGSSRAKLNKSDMLKIKVLIPRLDEQKKIADFLSALDDKIALVADELDKAKTFKKGLLQQMFV